MPQLQQARASLEAIQSTITQLCQQQHALEADWQAAALRNAPPLELERIRLEIEQLEANITSHKRRRDLAQYHITALTEWRDYLEGEAAIAQRNLARVEAEATRQLEQLERVRQAQRQYLAHVRRALNVAGA